MASFPSDRNIETLSAVLESERPLPSDPASERLVYWHVFREPAQALSFARGVQLEASDALVGGRTRDSVGPLYWIGVQVADLEAWGHRASIKKIDGVDPENPDSPML